MEIIQARTRANTAALRGLKEQGAAEGVGDGLSAVEVPLVGYQWVWVLGTAWGHWGFSGSLAVVTM